MPLSTKDKIRLSLSAKRVKAWEAFRREIAFESGARRNPRYLNGERRGQLKRCQNTVLAFGQERPKEVIRKCILDME